MIDNHENGLHQHDCLMNTEHLSIILKSLRNYKRVNSTNILAALVVFVVISIWNILGRICNYKHLLSY